MAVPRESLWASGHDESVEVNQRALIDKVLARYSGEFTVFRELLQNSDDAQATAVEIHFNTQTYIDSMEGSSESGKALPDLKTTLVHRWTFKNNGIIFREEDWTRLKKIAEGNPDEEKIGAFGPIFGDRRAFCGFWEFNNGWVSTGKTRKTRRGQIPSSDDGPPPWTVFEMVLREPAPIPMAFDFTRFLTSSITFMTYLSEVSFFLDDKRLARLRKTSGIPKELGLPKGLRTSTESGIMTVKDIKCTPLHIQAEVLQWVYSSGTDRKRPMSTSKPKATASSFFSSFLAAVAGNSTPQLQSTPLPLVKDLDPQTLTETNVALSVFSAAVDVHLNKKIAAELYRSTKKNPPNKLKYELIYTAKDEYDASKREEEQQPAAIGSIFQGLRADLEGSGATRIFIGHATGQTTGIAGHMAARFIPTVERESIDLMDRNVAIWNKELLYVGGLLARAAYEMEMESVKSLWEGSLPLGLPQTSVDQELETWLRSRSLHALKFFTFHPSTPSAEISHQLERAFFGCAGSNFPLISTAGVRNASDVRLPDPSFSGFLKQLPLLPENILADASTTIGILQSRGLIKSIGFEDVLKELHSRPLAEDEMVACLKWWISVNKEASKFQLAPRKFLEAAVFSLSAPPGSNDERIIPLSSIRIVTLPSGSLVKAPLERVLVALGVRKHVDLQVVFNRMIKTNEWTVADLAKYLVSIQSALSPEEWARLKMTAAFFKEETLKGDTGQNATRYQAQKLYEPVDVFRNLGLPVIDWGKQTKWRSSSDEAKFLFELGLLRYPPLPVLINLCGSKDSHVRTTALKYLLDNIGNHYKDYEPSNFETIAFIPAMQGSTPCIGTVKEVFSHPDWAMMGFLVTPDTLPLDAILKLKIKKHPPTAMLVDFLERKSPQNQAEARTWFSVLGSRVSDFSPMELQQMSRIKMVPVPSEDGKLRWLEPTCCYFGRDAQGEFRSKLFVFVDFGLIANSFLTACGTKHEPSIEEVVQILLENPHKFYASAEGPTQFLAELRNIAVNHKLIKPGTIGRMKKAAILLGLKRKPRKGGEKVDLDDFDEDEWEVQYDLRKAEEIIIADDTHALQAFGDSFFTAPQEDILEAFYTQLGSRRLSSLVKEDYQSSAEIKQSKTAAELRALILERLPLFLHEHSHARTRVSYTWLMSQVNFVVKTFGKLSVKKSLMFGDLRLSRQQEASAVAIRIGNTGPIHLWIAGNAQIDMYEILRQQKIERQVAEKAREEKNSALLSMPPTANLEDLVSSRSASPPTPIASPIVPPVAPVPLISKPPPGKPLFDPPKTPSLIVEPPPTPSRNPLDLFRRKTRLAPPPEFSPQIPSVSHKSPITPNADPHVTPLKNICECGSKTSSF
ncbi:hypothetical protein C0992_006158 [Termitomyces sp. T32_za158]|nr:hypothetical protein C0992_006158 [Termitomyces sp. T32_za158]